jgi:regulatory protein
MTVKDVAFRLLGAREHSRHELQQKLLSRAFSHTEVDDVLDYLEAETLLCDQRFANSFVRSSVARGHGPNKIRSGLIRRSVAEDIVVSSLGDCEVDWVNLAEQVLKKKFGDTALASLYGCPKMQRFLYGRGFDSNTIQLLWHEA